MKHSRTEVSRWRMLRQISRRRSRWLEAQSRRNIRLLTIRKILIKC
ncbi:YciY family protein [Enterobacteriaceae bacterium ESL0689]|nr:YciY family protein [Enterobacteriaceae bacterium ESL0689]